MIANLLDMVFGCWHKRCSFPITAKPGQRRGAAELTGTYIVCLDCGKEFPYDWQNMQIIADAEQASGLAKPVESYAGK